MVSLVTKGNFNNIKRFLYRMSNWSAKLVLESYGRKGVEALAAATPMRSGKTASSWAYNVTGGDGSWEIEWYNSNVNNGVNIALILQYGHGTGTGGYVTGIDYVNPALRPVFESFIDDIWREVTK